MRRIVIAASTLAAALVLGTGSASGQFYVGAYASLPMGDFGDAANTGWMAEAGFKFYESADERISFYVSGAYGQNGSDAEDLDFTQITGLAQVVYDLATGGSATPYLLGSVGYMSQKVDIGIADATEGGLAYGGGIGVGFAKRFWVEGRYLGASIDGSNTSMIVLGGGISF